MSINPNSIKFLPLVLALATPPAWSATPGAFAAWVPAGWKLLSSSTGDLNQDGRDDAVLVLEQNDPANIIANEYEGPDKLNLNPRALVILLAKAGGYREVFHQQDLLPSENDEELSCQEDPLSGGGVKIDDGAIVIGLRKQSNCDKVSWVSSETYRFRLEGERFWLVAQQHMAYSRVSGESEEESVDFVTRKRRTVVGLHKSGSTGQPKVTVGDLSGRQHRYLDEMLF